MAAATFLVKFAAKGGTKTVGQVRKVTSAIGKQSTALGKQSKALGKQSKAVDKQSKSIMGRISDLNEILNVVTSSIDILSFVYDIFLNKNQELNQQIAETQDNIAAASQTQPD
ncbi:MAG: hypothetical protein F6K24_31500, partial [Okeania sp. SIO2D1]|nr:hypothetical protein [Okeania sp. SIO2D1]